MTDETREPTKRPAADSYYLLLVGGLLLLICIALGVLWMTERKRRVRAEENLVQTRQALREFQALMMPDLDGAGPKALSVPAAVPVARPGPARPATTPGGD